MKLALIAILMIAGAAEAATVAVWRGPGPNACRSACSLDWAVEQLGEAQRDEVLAAMDEGGARPILVHPGDVFEFMSYQRGGEPYVDRRRTVAGMEAPARSWGWRFEDWSFVQLEACGNWAAVVHGERVAAPVAPAAAPAATTTIPPSVALAPAAGALFGAPTAPFGSAFAAIGPGLGTQSRTPGLWDRLIEPQPPFAPPRSDPDPDPLPPTPPVATIPLPQGAALLLAAFGLFWARRRRA